MPTKTISIVVNARENVVCTALDALSRVESKVKQV